MATFRKTQKPAATCWKSSPKKIQYCRTTITPADATIPVTPAMDEWMTYILVNIPSVPKLKMRLEVEEREILDDIDFLTKLLKRNTDMITQERKDKYQIISNKYKNNFPEVSKRISEKCKRDRELSGAKSADITRWTKS